MFDGLKNSFAPANIWNTAANMVAGPVSMMTNYDVTSVKTMWSPFVTKDLPDIILGNSYERGYALTDIAVNVAEIAGPKGISTLGKIGLFSKTAAAVKAASASKGVALGGMFGRTVKGGEKVAEIATKHPLKGLSVENVVRLADEIGLETPRDQLILWSGLGRGSEGVKLAQEFALKNGGITLEMTKGGSWLNEMDLFGANSPFTRAEAVQIWDHVSTNMIQQASGQVRSVLGQVRPASIYRAEQVELMMNSKITGLDELYLKPRFTFGK